MLQSRLDRFKEAFVLIAPVSATSELWSVFRKDFDLWGI
jgi:hypothetical protein